MWVLWGGCDSPCVSTVHRLLRSYFLQMEMCHRAQLSLEAMTKQVRPPPFPLPPRAGVDTGCISAGSECCQAVPGACARVWLCPRCPVTLPRGLQAFMAELDSAKKGGAEGKGKAAAEEGKGTAAADEGGEPSAAADSPAEAPSPAAAPQDSPAPAAAPTDSEAMAARDREIEALKMTISHLRDQAEAALAQRRSLEKELEEFQALLGDERKKRA